MEKKVGAVIWITGLSGAGKTMLGEKIYNKIKRNNKNTVFLDGDSLRDIFNFRDKNSYSSGKRLEIALGYSRLCKYLSEQNINVICSTISLFKKVHTWNRKNLDKYFEVYLKNNIKILSKNDSKKIYSKSEKEDVYGINISYDEPSNPDYEYINDFNMLSCEKAISKIIEQLKLKKFIKTDIE